MKNFLDQAAQFQLGELITETSHHLTSHLSELAQTDLAQALNQLSLVDNLALRVLEEKVHLLYQLGLAIEDCRQRGGRVLLVGCGATGRLSLLLETLNRQMFKDQKEEHFVHAFMAGGDYALIRSVESFEDFPDYGARQLREFFPTKKDLLIGITEGGETPFVIGATLEAAKLGLETYFLFCNPPAKLEPFLRCQSVLTHPRIQTLDLTCGAMALTGSTRMQASTVQMAAVGFALWMKGLDFLAFKQLIVSWSEWTKLLQRKELIPFIEREAEIYKNQQRVNYCTDEHLGLGVLTDTTERSPTFSQLAFENNLHPEETHAPVYLCLLGTKTAPDAWRKILSRTPRALNWKDSPRKIDLAEIYGFDISEQVLARRRDAFSFSLLKRRLHIEWKLENLCWHQSIFREHPLFYQLELKLALNQLSTLVMGRIERYQGNYMTWVRPTNFKLIDRSARFLEWLLKAKGMKLSYEERVQLILNKISSGTVDRVVLEVFKELSKD
jgi:N-acetylmuramic acid 6-phosphate etherase